VIVDQVNVVDVSGIETEHHAPISRDVDRPEPLEITLQTMQAIARKVEILILRGGVQVCQDGASKECSDRDRVVYTL
jgi:hypothetical protein